MSYKENLRRRGLEYAQRHALTLVDELGTGVHGSVFLAEKQSAIKVHQGQSHGPGVDGGDEPIEELEVSGVLRRTILVEGKQIRRSDRNPMETAGSSMNAPRYDAMGREVRQGVEIDIGGCRPNVVYDAAPSVHNDPACAFQYDDGRSPPVDPSRLGLKRIYTAEDMADEPIIAYTPPAES
jgi:hypothetical protein